MPRDNNITTNHFNGPVNARGGSFGSGSIVNVWTNADGEADVEVPETYGSGSVTNVFVDGVGWTTTEDDE